MSVTVALTELPEDLDGYLQGIAPLSHEAHQLRAQAFNNRERRAEFLTGRRLLAQLCHHRQVDYRWPTEEQVKQVPGKVLEAGTGINASISHSGNYILAALGVGVQRLGVDCECGGHTRNFRAVARRHFTDREAVFFNGLSDEDLKKHFLRHWVVKESWLKATGKGIAGGLKTVELLPQGQLALHSTEYGGSWSFWQGTFDGAVMGLAWQSSQELEPEFLSVTDLLDDNPVLSPAAAIRGERICLQN